MIGVAVRKQGATPTGYWTNITVRQRAPTSRSLRLMGYGDSSHEIRSLLYGLSCLHSHCIP